MSQAKDWALVTGASGGIGESFARLFAKHGVNLILVARSTDALEVIKQEIENKYQLEAQVIVADLSKIQEVERVAETIQNNGWQVSYLINNAGFGNKGAFIETQWPREHEMIELNVVALTYLSKVFGRLMAEGQGGKIVNVASSAGFLSGPYMAVYYATKAYVLHFSEAIGYELKNKGVTVTALCPGPTATKFARAAKADAMGIFTSPDLPNADQVADYGFKAMMQGKPVAIHGIRNKLGLWSTRFLPRQFVTRIIGGAQR